MSTLLDDITVYLTEHPYATVRHLLDEFGRPVHDQGRCGQFKTYTDLIWQRDGQFVLVEHRNFGDGKQIARCREVEPMEKVTVTVVFVPSVPLTGEYDLDWHYNTGMVADAEAHLEALAKPHHHTAPA